MSGEQFSGPWFPWFHGDFLRATQGWTVFERGVYILLLGASWEMGPLPNDRRRLAGIVGSQLDEFDEAWKIVQPKFKLTDDGLINQRLETHRATQALRSEKARQSANKRWQDDSDANAGANAGANAMLEPMLEGMLGGCSSELITHNSEKGKSSAAAAAAAKSAPVAFHKQVIAAYHRLCPTLPHIKTWPKHRKEALDARIRERCADGKPADTIKYWEDFFEMVAASDFLCGRTKDPFAGTGIDWLLGPKNFPKVIEENYSNRKSNGERAHG
jgi:uncharacterized protein YdaU (DUF1376 family)